MKTAEELAHELACIEFNDPACSGQMLPRPQKMRFIESVQSDARKDLEQERDTLQREVQELRQFEHRVDEVVFQITGDEGDECSLVVIKQHCDTLQRSNAELQAAAGFCEKHKPDGGARNCLVCGCIELSHALHQIDYIFSEKTEMEVSDYDLHQNPDEVVSRTKLKVAELSAQVERLREALNWFIEKTSMEGSIDGKPYCRWCYSKSGHEVNCLIGQALSLTPSDALKEYMKPWVEFVELANQKLKFLLDECDWEGDERIPLAFDGMQGQALQLLASIGK